MELGCVSGGALRPIGAGFQNVNSGRLAGSSHQDCEQVVWRVKRASRGRPKQVKGRSSFVAGLPPYQHIWQVKP